ncbi:response regulator transcription factor [Acuticoccus sp. MNP-M23]|uniref:response regulator transcription factor n=1 Tax=Acuticoccus sp. MNP-M23 TaxID=3072793 RepID=UPI0028149F3E|nr:response regulator transcription factor [Acuticoccus sp. MNP-M23]WMS42076.1 response regulator transcription factor [Acuticoccus sp. MNP-M23]
MKVLFADDHGLVRDTVCAFLEREPGIAVTVACDYPQAAELITRDGPFDLVVLDFAMPGMNGLDGLRDAMLLNFNNPVAIISGTIPRAAAEEALAIGAAGFLPKTMPARSLVNALRFMASGEQYAPVRYLTETADVPAHPLVSKLSRREMQVLEGLSKGKTNKEIARDLGLQEVTIKLHVKTLCRKLDARNRTQAAMAASAAGLF